MYNFFLLRLPFSWKTPLGYAIAFLLECMSTFAIAYSILPPACFALGSYLLVVAAIKAITKDFQILCEKIPHGNHQELKKLLCSLIENISNIKQLREIHLLFNLL